MELVFERSGGTCRAMYLWVLELPIRMVLNRHNEVPVALVRKLVPNSAAAGTSE
jgi:hypothetical protein